jgi:hypothetical protein
MEDLSMALWATPRGTRLFEAEIRGRAAIAEDSLTAKVLGECWPDYAGAEQLLPSVRFWPIVSASGTTKTEKPSREFDAGIVDSKGRPMAFVESKWGSQLTLGQVRDEFRLAGQASTRPRLILLTATEELPQEVQDYLRSAEAAGGIKHLTWHRLAAIVGEHKGHFEQISRESGFVATQLSRLLYAYGFGEARGLKPEQAKDVRADWEAVGGFLKEVELVVGDIERSAKSGGIVGLKQAGGERLWRDGTSRRLDWRGWLVESLVFPFADRSWYTKKPCSFEYDSYLYVAFSPKNPEAYVGYWGKKDEISKDADLTTSMKALRTVPMAIAHAGASWQDEHLKSQATELEPEFLTTARRENHFDIYYGHPTTELTESRIRDFRKDAISELVNLRDFVEKSEIGPSRKP